MQKYDKPIYFRLETMNYDMKMPDGIPNRNRLCFDEDDPEFPHLLINTIDDEGVHHKDGKYKVLDFESDYSVKILV